MKRLSPYVALLRRNPAFRRLYAAQLISFAGDWFATVALLGLVLELTGSAAAASLVIVLQTGGFALASPIAGVLADRLDRRRLMVIADFVRVPVALALVSFARRTHSGSASWRSRCWRSERRFSSQRHRRRCPTWSRRMSSARPTCCLAPRGA